MTNNDQTVLEKDKKKWQTVFAWEIIAVETEWMCRRESGGTLVVSKDYHAI